MKRLLCVGLVAALAGFLGSQLVELIPGVANPSLVTGDTIALSRTLDLMSLASSLGDETGVFECVLFPETFQEFGDILHWENLFIIRGTVEESFGVHSITIEKMGSLQRGRRGWRGVHCCDIAYAVREEEMIECIVCSKYHLYLPSTYV